jgi:hypothetical protein
MSPISSRSSANAEPAADRRRRSAVARFSVRSHRPRGDSVHGSGYTAHAHAEMIPEPSFSFSHPAIGTFSVDFVVIVD